MHPFAHALRSRRCLLGIVWSEALIGQIGAPDLLNQLGIDVVLVIRLQLVQEVLFIQQCH